MDSREQTGDLAKSEMKGPPGVGPCQTFGQDRLEEARYERMTQTNQERRPVDRIQLHAGAHVHFMGICGTAMASLAGLLHSQGYKVTGSDQNVYPPMSTQLADLGIRIMNGYHAANLTSEGRPDLVIVGNVITRKHEEAQALLSSDIPFTSLPQAMGQLVIDHRHSVVVAGTHGKTTTSSMNAFVADALQLHPGFMIGGIPKNFAQSYRFPKGDWFVIEGDEYDTAFFDKVPKFIHYRPRSVILNSVEFDHADIYRDLEHVKQAFLSLLDLIPPKGLLVTCEDEDSIRDLLARRKDRLKERDIRVLTFGLERGQYRASQIEACMADPVTGRRGTRFLVERPERKSVQIELPMIGHYNVKNALATLALWENLGFPTEAIVEALRRFDGVKRRQDVLGRSQSGGYTVMEDFAHHPTAVRETIRTVQSQYPDARVFSVFEARSATSRRNVFQREYAEAFREAQCVLMPPPFNQSGIPESERFSAEQLIGELRQAHVDANLLGDVDAIVAFIKSKARPQDLVLVMSNGGFDGIYAKLLA